MEIIHALATKVLPLYGFIILGFFIKRKWDFNSKWISKPLLHALIPILIIDNLLKADLQQAAVAGSVILLLAIAMNVPGHLARKITEGKMEPNLVNVSFSYFNIGWFGIPVVMALFGEEQLPLIISAYVGNVIYGDSVGYYLVSRTKGLSKGEAIANVFKIPAIYATIAAIILNLLEVKPPEGLEGVTSVVSWAVSAAGMFLIGITLSDVKYQEIQGKLFAKLLTLRYLSGAVLLGGLVLLERWLVGVLEPEQSALMMLIASFPIAANLVVFTSVLETEEKNAALLVGISSLISLVLVPVVCLLLF